MPRESATRVQLSPSLDAVISGPGRIVLLKGRDAYFLSEREARRLLEEWVVFEALRRHGSFDALIASLSAKVSEAGVTPS